MNPNENSSHSFTEGSDMFPSEDSGTLKFSNPVSTVKEERPNAERILLTKIIDASGGDYNEIEKEIEELSGDPAHAIVLNAMEEYATALNSVILKENQELKAALKMVNEALTDGLTIERKDPIHNKIKQLLGI